MAAFEEDRRPTQQQEELLNRLGASDIAVPEEKAECVASGGVWKNSTFNNDNLGEALMTLFYVVSFDGWVGLALVSSRKMMPRRFLTL